jgi:hypothetical protein
MPQAVRVLRVVAPGVVLEIERIFDDADHMLSLLAISKKVLLQIAGLGKGNRC